MTPMQTVAPIGTLRSCFPDKFGVPRQPGLCPHARGQIVLAPPWNTPDAFRGLDGFSHIWITFLFDRVDPETGPRVLIRPPRLGGNRRVGVFASRSPFRPNRIGLSVVRQQGLIHASDSLSLAVSELDLVDGTPVLDIKPYLPWCDSPADATANWAGTAPTLLRVEYASQAVRQIHGFSRQRPDLEPLINEVLAQDPRPAYLVTQASDRRYSLGLYDLDVHWRVAENTCLVESVTPRELSNCLVGESPL